MGLPGSSQVRLDVWQRAELRRLHVYLVHSKAAFYSQPNVITVKGDRQKQGGGSGGCSSSSRPDQTHQASTKVDSSASLLDGYLREADAVRAELAAWAEVEGRGPSRISNTSPGAADSNEKYFNLGFTAGVRFCHEAMQKDSDENDPLSESSNSEIVSDLWEEEHFDEVSSSTCGSTSGHASDDAEAMVRTEEIETRSSGERLKCETWPRLHGTAACGGDSANNIDDENRVLPKTTVWRGDSSPALLRTEHKRRSL
ncbi:uncharacterized protein LOC111262828 isoform X2 [Varroa jacobsoni]|uniref:Uncharacterized protein n=1 Tax=Varroa destructor TaxID=109461 RepID=A0A7M7KKL5_VARDE|nr:uncharacterized protein LOC111253326 isoform X2 [Varroa destructor]XP_022693133.1 uncharacterized protein LOC111262828 isoform X2 [Varroa jacobsoni]